MRATPAVKHLLQQAAQLNHKNVSEFLLDAGVMLANQSLADRRRFVLEDAQWAEFNAALERPVTDASSKARLRKLLSEPSILH